MVQLKRKVTIKTKHAVEEPPVHETSIRGHGNEPKSNKKWLLLAITAIIVVVGVIGFMQFNPSSSNNDGAEQANSSAYSTNAGGEDGSVQTKAKQDEADNTDASNGENEDKSGVEEANASHSTSNQSTESENAETTAPYGTNRNAPVQSATSGNDTPTGSIEEEARQVIRGIYGNGSVRKQKLGDRYSEIQSKVNEMYRTGQVH